jgi:hypothetical protein
MAIHEIQNIAHVAEKKDLKLAATTYRVPSIDPGILKQLWHIYFEYYTDTSEDLFRHDLSRKSHVIVLWDKHNNSIQGFSTFHTYHTQFGTRRIAVFFSGDTVVRKEYWGQTAALHLAFVRNAYLFWLRNVPTPTYWFLLTKGYRTYLLLSRNSVNYYPRHDRETPPFEKTLIDHLAREKFGDAWKPEEGVVRFDKPAGRLRENVAPIRLDLLKYSDIRFFNQMNPRHVSGEELCCIGKLDLQTMFGYFGKRGRKVLKREWRRNNGKRL